MIIVKNKGFVLVSGLILLLIITIIALSGTANSILQEKSAGGLQDKQIAFQNAETALRVAENYVYLNINTSSLFAVGCSAGLCITNPVNPVWENINFKTDTNKFITLSGSDIISKTTSQPKYIIELLDEVPAIPGESIKVTTSKVSANAYRITTIAYGNSIGSEVMLQSIFVKR